MEVKYFQKPKEERRSLRPPTMGTKPGEGLATLVSENNITDEELQYLLDPDLLREWAPLSLQERCVRFKRRFPDRLLRSWTLRKLMRQAGCKKKKVLVRRAAQRKTQRLEEFEQLIQQLAQQVSAVQKSGGHLVFADETIFNSRNFQMSAWAPPGQNIAVEDRTGNQPCLAVCAAVCKCHGLLAFTIEEHSYDGQKFINFLREVRAAAGDGKVHLFLDNCGVHKAWEVKDEYKKLDIHPIWNVPYTPEYNAAIELYWAQLKARYRPLLLQKMLLTPRARDKPMREALYQAIKENDGSSIPAFIDHGLRALYEDAEQI